MLNGSAGNWLILYFGDFRIPPKALQRVEVPEVSSEDVGHHTAIVEEHPFFIVFPLRMPCGFFGALVNLLADRVGDRAVALVPRSLSAS